MSSSTASTRGPQTDYPTRQTITRCAPWCAVTANTSSRCGHACGRSHRRNTPQYLCGCNQQHFYYAICIKHGLCVWVSPECFVQLLLTLNINFRWISGRHPPMSRVENYFFGYILQTLVLVCHGVVNCNSAIRAFAPRSVAETVVSTWLYLGRQ